MESMLDQLADGIRMDPEEIRLKNAIKTGDTSVHGWVIRSGGLTECIKKSIDKSGWKEKRTGVKDPSGEKVKGIGMGSALHVTAMKFIGQSWGCGAIVKINDDGTANLITGEGDCGQGARTVLSQICAEELGIPFEDVWASPADTDIAPYTGGPVSSRTTATAGTAVKLAAADAKKQLFASAAEKLNVGEKELTAKGQQIFVHNDSEKSVSFAEAAMGPSFRPIIGKGRFIPTQAGVDFKTWYGDAATSYSFCNQIVEVEVNTKTGEVKVLTFTGAFDLGKAINPKAAEGQIEGGLAMGIGWAMTENLEPQKGKIVGNQLTDYKLPTTLEMPKIVSILIETEDPVCPFGAKGIGEIVLVPTAAAIANAIYDAVGIRMKELPITPEKLLKALKEKSTN
jgi:CO/xanthine dehydrogenase Mo-binding subunit